MVTVQTGQNSSVPLYQVLSIAIYERLHLRFKAIIISAGNLLLRDYHKQLLLVLRRRIIPDSAGPYLSESAP